MSTMFQEEFFPTPLSVITRMLQGLDLKQKLILEPSAGAGDIVDFISGLRYNCKIYCCEVNPDLQFTLQGKGYKLVHDDFLSYQPLHDFDLIVMNPPFSNGDEHLLHAWEILKGGDIVCLLNAETIRNPYTQRRKLLCSIIEQNGNVEFLGPVFAQANRKTNVDVAMVRLHKDKAINEWTIDIDGKKDADVNFSELTASSNELYKADVIDAYIRAWHEANEAAKALIKARARLNLFSESFSGETKILDFNGTEESKMKEAYHEWLDSAKTSAWKKIISQLGMHKYMTSNLQQNFDKFCVNQGCYELTRENIFKLYDFVGMNISSIMNKAVVDLFDKFTRYDKGNTNHTEGWKTNSAFKVNKRVILPAFVEASQYADYFRAKIYYSSEYNDIEKVMCYLSGFPYENLINYIDRYKTYTEEQLQNKTLRCAIEEVKIGDSSWHESKFFRFRCYKKGTLHIEFKEEKLWADFNLAVCKGKNMIGK